MDNRLITVGGVTFIVGGIVGFLVARKLLEEHYQELAEIEIGEMSDYYKEKYMPSSNPEKYRQLVDVYAKPDLHKLVKETSKDEDEENEEMDELIEDELLDIDEPYLIDYEKYIRPTDIFDKVELYYYRGDDTVCDPMDQIMEDPEDILGWDWMGQLELQTTVFVRNEVKQKDYEIHAIPQSYRDAVSSRIETDKEKKFRRTARQKEAMDSFSSELIEYEDQLKKKKPYVRPTKRQITEEIANDLADDELYSS